ncbi:MAG: Mur ligase domain-containing protein [Victivallaceae bacterium]
MKTDFSIAPTGNYHFIGIGGAGMAPLAAILLERGCKVSGSDLEMNSKTDVLSSNGAVIFTGHAARNIPDVPALTVVYSSAVTSTNSELAEAVSRGIPCFRRGEFLARLMKFYRHPVAISGSHGKTSVTAMLAFILRQCGINCGFMVGGKVNRFPSSAAGDGDIFVTEVDESDGTHALVAPWLCLISNVEDDHSWSVGGEEQLFKNFSRLAGQSEQLIYVRDINSSRLFAGHPKSVRLEPENILMEDYFSCWTDSARKKFAGFQRLNAALACAAAEKLGIERHQAEQALMDFPGVARRMTIHFDSPNLTVVEDYAHHPTELAHALAALRLSLPKHHLRVVFQPHRYARLKKYIDGFAVELAKADSVFVVPVFAAWTETGEVNSAMLTTKIGGKASYLDGGWDVMPPVIMAEPENDSRPLLLAIIGAGDIELLVKAVCSALDSRI